MDDTQSVGDVRVVGTTSDYDDQSSYLSLKYGGNSEYSDVESSGNIIKITSGQSSSSYLELKKNQSQYESSQYSGSI